MNSPGTITQTPLPTEADPELILGAAPAPVDDLAEDLLDDEEDTQEDTQPECPPGEPTDALPGSERKIRILVERAARREPLFHPLDGPGLRPEREQRTILVRKDPPAGESLLR